MKSNKIEDGKVLMIGDLVVGCIETDIVGEATYKILCKVTDINHYGDVICEALEPFPDELDWQDGDDFSWIEPIPLTPEILEKNGFVTNDEQGNWKGYRIYSLFNTDKSCIFMLKLYEKDSIVEISLDMSPYYIVFKFVHQLQHALRLCVDKTIEL